jgi:dienelactone hydrolase
MLRYTSWTSELQILSYIAQASRLTIHSFGGEVISPEVFEDPAKRAAFNIPEFIGRNSKEIRFPEIKANAQELKKQYKKVGAIGYCYGAWAVFKLGGDPSLIDAVSGAHPSLVVKEELDGLKVPVQIIAPENDHAFTPELKEHSNKVIPGLGVPYEYVYFPGVNHGFAARGDEKDPVQKHALERAKRSAVNFFNEFLH